MKRKFLPFLLIIVAGMTLLTGCPGKTPPAPTLIDLLKGKTFVLGTVTRTLPAPATAVTSDFTGFKITFNDTATTGTITTGGANSQVFNVNYSNLGTTATIAPPPTNWAGTLTEFSVTSTSLKFKVLVSNPKTGDATFEFNLVQ